MSLQPICVYTVIPTKVGIHGFGFRRNDLFIRPASSHAPLVITLNGFSKMLALPGLKIGWMAITGDPSRTRKAIRALDMISDTFLPVSEIAQAAVPHLLRDSKTFQAPTDPKSLSGWSLRAIF